MSRARSTRLGRRIVVVLGLIALATLVGGIADAYWRAGGSGSGSAATSTTVPVTLTPGSATAGLYPGGTTDVVLGAGNSNLATVRLASLGLDTTRGTGGFTVDASHTGCALSVLSLATQTNAGAGWTVPGKVGTVDGSLSITLANALSMSTSAANACQGATFTVYLTGA